MEEVEMREVEEALQRIGDGTYGKCLECGVDINIERIKVIPYAKLCINCQGEREKK